MKTTTQIPLGANSLIIETGHLAKQADGAVLVQYGETVVLATAVAAATPKEGQDFFPLTVDYREKSSAAGKFPGGYFKREGRPTEKEILTARMTDRPLRPLFPKGFFNDTQIIGILLSADGENDPDVLMINGASAALAISDIPFEGPVGAVRVGMINGEFIVNPTHPQIRESALDLIYVGTDEKLMMIEGSAQEVSEDAMMSAIEFAHGHVRKIIAGIRELQAKVGKPKRALKLDAPEPAVVKKARAFLADRLVPALMTQGKMERSAKLGALEAELKTALTAEFPNVTDAQVTQCFEDAEEEAIRRQILDHGKRIDGRGPKDLRNISCEVGVLPRTHGSALFSRGETQALVITTLGSQSDAQEFDAWTGGPTEKTFLLHYNFPPFSVGETGRTGAPGRREIGHGALAERSILQVMPRKKEDNWPYVVRCTSEIMESNGSTSMATVCGATLSLLDAGVPLKAPVAGISIGLVSEPDGSRAELITDIMGTEDFFGDMDFKVAGTREGITGFQTDLKIRGLSFDLARGAFQQAREARNQILDIMAQTLPQHREQFSKYAPRIEVLKIDPDKIGKLIGPGGKTINKIVAETGVQIDIEDDGTVNIFSNNGDAMARAKEIVEGITGEFEIGKIYRGTVVTIKEFGAFVEVFPGADGLVHISELADRRVERTEDVVKLGDVIDVKCIGIDDKGRVKLSRKAAMAEKDAIARGEPIPPFEPSQPSEPRESRPRREDRFERGDRRDRGDRGERGGRGGRDDRRDNRDNRDHRGEREERGGYKPVELRGEEEQQPVERPDVEIGKVVRGKVVSLKDYGAFVEIQPGVEGLVHISEWAEYRVRRMEDVTGVGDEVWVKIIGVDERGRVKLSRKAALSQGVS
jgi:polyribonucleotide nucleotidyltransferase